MTPIIIATLFESKLGKLLLGYWLSAQTDIMADK